MTDLIPRNPGQDAREWCERQWQLSNRHSGPQKPCDEGLFGDERLQVDLMDLMRLKQEE